MQCWGYLRVSTEAQDTESQRIGLDEYAKAHGFLNMEIVSETSSRSVDWRKRELGKLLEKTRCGDVLCTSEFTRLAGSPGQVFGFLEAASEKGVIVHITKTGTVMDGSMQSKLLASVFSMASMIEVSFIRERTKEGLRRVKNEGKKLGRPKGTTGKSKLDAQEETIRGYVAIELPKRRMAKLLGVSYNTIDRYIKQHHLIKGGLSEEK
jgi:putative DNA-invertase from lambdoid prophage Rac